MSNAVSNLSAISISLITVSISDNLQILNIDDVPILLESARYTVLAEFFNAYLIGSEIISLYSEITPEIDSDFEEKNIISVLRLLKEVHVRDPENIGAAGESSPPVQ